jgi:hypothetical protein
MISYKRNDIIYDITFFLMISCSISQKHTFLAFLEPSIIDITNDITAEIMEKGYDMKITRYHRPLSHCIPYDVV